MVFKCIVKLISSPFFCPTILRSTTRVLFSLVLLEYPFFQYSGVVLMSIARYSSRTPEFLYSTLLHSKIPLNTLLYSSTKSQYSCLTLIAIARRQTRRSLTISGVRCLVVKSYLKETLHNLGGRLFPRQPGISILWNLFSQLHSSFLPSDHTNKAYSDT